MAKFLFDFTEPHHLGREVQTLAVSSKDKPTFP